VGKIDEQHWGISASGGTRAERSPWARCGSRWGSAHRRGCQPRAVKVLPPTSARLAA
jgi:hypothetical protein